MPRRPATGRRPTIADSGVINYINKFGQMTTANHKTYDPVSELYYAAIRYLRNQGNIPEYTDADAAPRRRYTLGRRLPGDHGLGRPDAVPLPEQRDAGHRRRQYAPRQESAGQHHRAQRGARDARRRGGRRHGRQCGHVRRARWRRSKASRSTRHSRDARTRRTSRVLLIGRTRRTSAPISATTEADRHDLLGRRSRERGSAGKGQ